MKAAVVTLLTLRILSGGSSQEINLANRSADFASFETHDPNFLREGAHTFSGLKVESLLDWQKPHAAATFIGSDQYVVRVPTVDLVRDGTLLAVTSDGKQIEKSAGGPIKLVFKKTRQREDYGWYVRTMVLGDTVEAPLVVKSGGRESLWPLARLADKGALISDVTLPVPRGMRHGWDGPKAKGSVAVIALGDLAGARSKASRAVVHDLVGNRFDIDLREPGVSYLLAFHRDGAPIPVALGGPYLLLKVKGRVDGSFDVANAQFFIDAIDLDL